MAIIHKIGRRKTSVARVYLQEGKGEIYINGRELKDYFTTGVLQYKVEQPFALTGNTGKYNVDIKVFGGEPPVRQKRSDLQSQEHCAKSTMNSEHSLNPKDF